MDRIVIRDLRIQTRVGVSDEERSRPQPLLVNIEIGADLSAAGDSDELADTVDYDRVITEIADVLKTEEAKLLEHVADSIAAVVVRFKGVRTVTVEVLKELPPVAENVGPVGVRIERSAG
jgi:dihydroneopterin aldolase